MPRWAFVGCDMQGDACIYVGRVNADGDFDGDYLTAEELGELVDQLNARFEGEDDAV